MNQKTNVKLVPIIAVLVLSFILAACGSSAKAQENIQANPGNAQTTPGPRGFDLSKMTLQDKLAIGTLKLEGTNLAVDSKEAAALLPLWSAVQSLGTSSSTSPQEMDALYAQIQGAMTPDQIKAITAMTFTQDDISKLMASLGIEFGQGQRGTRTPGSSSGNGGQTFRPGGPGGPGDFPGGGNFRQGGNNGSTQTTPNPNRPNIRRGVSFIFLRPLINLLKQRAGS